MTIREVLLSSGRQPLLTVFFLLMTAQLALIFLSFRDERKHRIRLGFLACFLLSFVIFYLTMVEVGWNNDYPDGTVPRPDFLVAFDSLPVTWILAYEVLIALLLLGEFIEFIWYWKNHPTIRSIKETLDLLPVGIAFGKPEGPVVFSNLAMNRLSRALSGRPMEDLQVFRAAVAEMAPEAAEPGRPVRLPDGSAAWQLASKPLEVDGNSWIQVTAADITREAEVAKELAEKNKALRDIHMRLDLYNRQAERIIIAQELLAARMEVHNELGSVLLESRLYLNEPEAIDEEVLLQALRTANTYLLREYEQDDSAGDPLAEAFETAEAIGVETDLAGDLPEGEPARGILAAGIRECATNTVKHAGGDTLCVRIRESREGTAFSFAGNGAPPEGEITEAGGLRALRELVEYHRGTMKVESSPQARITILLPAAEEEKQPENGSEEP